MSRSRRSSSSRRRTACGDSAGVRRRHEQRRVAELLARAGHVRRTTGQPSANASSGGRFSGPKKLRYDERVGAAVERNQLVGVDEAAEADPLEQAELEREPADVVEVPLSEPTQTSVKPWQLASSAREQRGVVLVRPVLRRVEEVGLARSRAVACRLRVCRASSANVGVGWGSTSTRSGPTGSGAAAARGPPRSARSTRVALRDVARVERVPELPLAFAG